MSGLNSNQKKTCHHQNLECCGLGGHGPHGCRCFCGVSCHGPLCKCPPAYRYYLCHPKPQYPYTRRDYTYAVGGHKACPGFGRNVPHEPNQNCKGVFEDKQDDCEEPTEIRIPGCCPGGGKQFFTRIITRYPDPDPAEFCARTRTGRQRICGTHGCPRLPRQSPRY